MGLLEDIMGMKNQGVSEEEIVTSLREKGVSPKEIKDAINQLKIKNAISEYGAEEKESLFKNQEEEVQEKQNPFETQYAPQQQYTNYPPQQDYSQQGYAPQEGGYANYSSTGVDANTIIEISEQVFSEKIKSLQGELASFNEFKNINQMRLENLNDRLKRMETVFDKLQLTILEKIGSYGQNLELIKKEMNMMQDSFSKVLDPALDKAEKRQETRHQSTVHKKSSKSK